jgi:hypothetical protein
MKSIKVSRICWRHQVHSISSMMKEVDYDLLFAFLALSSHWRFRVCGLNRFGESFIQHQHVGKTQKLGSRFGRQAHKANSNIPMFCCVSVNHTL